MYRERTAIVPGGIVWTNVVTEPEQRILPDGCIDVIWVDGSLMVAGPDSRAYLNAAEVGTTFTGLRFAPGTAPALLGVPAHELRDQRVELEAVWDTPTVRNLCARIGDARSAEHALDDALADRWSRLDSWPTVEPAIARTLRAGASVAQAADLAGYSERQLHRRCLHAFGYGPKTLARVFRMHRALELSRRGVPRAEAAARAGYADQAHLAREVKDLAGVPMRAIVS